MPFGNRYAMPADNQFIAKEKTVPADPRCCRSRSWRSSLMPTQECLLEIGCNPQSEIYNL
jgi:hypothetical protein